MIEWRVSFTRGCSKNSTTGSGLINQMSRQTFHRWINRPLLAQPLPPTSGSQPSSLRFLRKGINLHRLSRSAHRWSIPCYTTLYTRVFPACRNFRSASVNLRLPGTVSLRGVGVMRFAYHQCNRAMHAYHQCSHANAPQERDQPVYTLTPNHQLLITTNQKLILLYDFYSLVHYKSYCKCISKDESYLLTFGCSNLSEPGRGIQRIEFSHNSRTTLNVGVIHRRDHNDVKSYLSGGKLFCPKSEICSDSFGSVGESITRRHSWSSLLIGKYFEVKIAKNFDGLLIEINSLHHWK